MNEVNPPLPQGIPDPWVIDEEEQARKDDEEQTKEIERQRARIQQMNDDDMDAWLSWNTDHS